MFGLEIRKLFFCYALLTNTVTVSHGVAPNCSYCRFEDIYNARLAYQAYEAADMKGMWIEKHTILRTLKVNYIKTCLKWPLQKYSKTCVKRPLSKRPKIGYIDQAFCNTFDFH